MPLSELDESKLVCVKTIFREERKNVFSLFFLFLVSLRTVLFPISLLCARQLYPYSITFISSIICVSILPWCYVLTKTTLHLLYSQRKKCPNQHCLCINLSPFYIYILLFDRHICLSIV